LKRATQRTTAMQITPTLPVNEAALEEKFMRSSGPGGQNVNKVETGVQLRFDVRRSGLPEEVQLRLLRRSDRRLNEAGVLVITAQSLRTREANRRDARERLARLIRQAAYRPKTRRATRPTAASQRRRVQEKRQRGQTKQRRRVTDGEA
jgi:ribosome-associated protein